MGMRLTRFCIYTIVKHYTLMDVQGHGHEHVCSHQTLITTNMYIGEEQNIVQSSSSLKENVHPVARRERQSRNWLFSTMYVYIEYEELMLMWYTRVLSRRRVTSTHVSLSKSSLCCIMNEGKNDRSLLPVLNCFTGWLLKIKDERSLFNQGNKNKARLTSCRCLFSSSTSTKSLAGLRTH